ncbi:FAD binding domain-containing protein [Cohnella caldifontis]|uniref:FAD binding domain-containing protein n=1 Tax=Cohnella caldifontis TaxID=3027471 RepID=UPI0023EC4EB8|nr:FAD binding domain-containing protein [Cohnella sp. YIM B05605]
MIPYDFEYYRPTTAMEAVRMFSALDGQGKSPHYYAGGTEIITLGRLNIVRTGAVIDIKGIRECQALEFAQDELVLGAGLTLTKLEDANPFPLLSKTASEVADRTARNQITLGGNLCGQIFYREATLPFLLTDSRVAIAGTNGTRQLSIHDVFNGPPRLSKGEILLNLTTSRASLALPHVSVKIRKQWKTGYPLITAAAVRMEDRIRVAFSGLCPFPFRSFAMEEALNERTFLAETRIERAILRLPAPILNDSEGSPEYRLFVLRNLLADILSEMEGD